MEEDYKQVSRMKSTMSSSISSDEVYLEGTRRVYGAREKVLEVMPVTNPQSS